MIQAVTSFPLPLFHLDKIQTFLHSSRKLRTILFESADQAYRILGCPHGLLADLVPVVTETLVTVVSSPRTFAGAFA